MTKAKANSLGRMNFCLFSAAKRGYRGRRHLTTCLPAGWKPKRECNYLRKKVIRDTKLHDCKQGMDMFLLQTIKFLTVRCNKIQNGLPKGTGSRGQGLEHTSSSRDFEWDRATRWSALAVTPFLKWWQLPVVFAHQSHRRVPIGGKRGRRRRRWRTSKETGTYGIANALGGMADMIIFLAMLLSNGLSEFCCESLSSPLSSKCLFLEQIIFVPYIRLLI